MKVGSLLIDLIEIKKIVRELYANETNCMKQKKFLEIQKPPKWTKEETENLNDL